MATDPSELYPVIAQIAAAFAGFGGLATALGRRKGADDARLDALRLFTMLQVSLTATLLGLLPATLAGLGVGARWAVGAPAVTALIIIGVRLPRAVRRTTQMARVTGWKAGAAFLNFSCVLVAFIAFALCALGLPKDKIGGLYLLGLTAVLGSSVIMFQLVITSMLRPHSEPDSNRDDSAAPQRRRRRPSSQASSP